MKAVEDANRWQTKSLRDLATINYGRSPAAILAEDGLYPVVGTGGSERLGNDYLHDGESIILGRKGTIDRVYFAMGRFWTIDTAYFLTDFTESVPRWLYYFLQTIDLRQMNEATGVPSLSRDLLYKIEILTPPKPDQTKIAEILSTVDRAIEQTEALIAKQQRIKTGLMQDLLTRGIDEHGNLRSERTHQFKDSPLGKIPVEWEVEKWSQVCRKIQDGTHFSPRTDSSAEFKYVTSKNIKFGFLDLSDVEYIDKGQHNEIYTRCDVCLGDVLLTKDGANTGNAAINLLNEEFSLLSSVALIRPLESKLTSMFLLQTILSESGQRLIKDAMSGLAITRVTLEIINNFLMKVPPIQEQKNMGQFLAVQDERIKSEAKKLAKLRSLKTALMQDLLTGKKRVTDLLDDTEAAGV